MLFLTALLFFATAQVQTSSQLTITVTDTSGGRVAGADIVLSRPTEKPRMLVTGDDGTVEVRDLPLGEWTLTISRQGFSTRQRAVVIQPVPVTANATLDVAGLSESVLVEAAPGPAHVLRLDAVAAGGTLLEIPIRELPASLAVVS